MEQANVHSNSKSLFGENVEMQFLEDGKDVYVVPASMRDQISPNDIVGDGHSGGEEFLFVSRDSADKMVASQDSNLISADLSQFETGMFTKDGVTLNGQRVIANDRAVDKSIVKQLTRNMYIRKQQDLSVDLGYRQWHMLREQNILLDEAQMQVIKEIDGNKRQFAQLDKNNPLSRQLGVQYYYDVRYKHYLDVLLYLL